MFDAKLRSFIDRPLNIAGRFLVSRHISANSVTYLAFIFACLSFFAVFIQSYTVALIFIFLNRLCDGLDGAIARQTIPIADNKTDSHSSHDQSNNKQSHTQNPPPTNGLTDLGAFLDIVFDFIFYSGIVFFFAAGRPEFLFPAAFLLFSFFGTASSFLAYAIMAEKNNISTDAQGKKGFYYLAGLAEGTETFLFIVLICILPEYFFLLAIGFAILCWLTTFGRILTAIKTLP